MVPAVVGVPGATVLGTEVAVAGTNVPVVTTGVVVAIGAIVTIGVAVGAALFMPQADSTDSRRTATARVAKILFIFLPPKFIITTLVFQFSRLNFVKNMIKSSHKKKYFLREVFYGTQR